MHQTWNLRLVIAATALLTATLLAGTQGWSDGERIGLPAIHAQQQAEITVRIAAKRLDDGRTELALQVQSGDAWSEARLLPSIRLLPANAIVDRWYITSPVTTQDGREARIAAKLRDTGQIEVALRVVTGGALSVRHLPERRVIPTNPIIDRWLHSTPLVLSDQGTTVVTTAKPVANANGQSETNARVTYQAGSSQRGRYALVRNSGQVLLFEVGCSSRNESYSYFSSFNVGDAESLDVSLSIDGVSSPTETWGVFRFGPDPSAVEGGVFPPDHAGLMGRLRNASRFTLTIHGASLPPASFNLTGMFDTPVQPNLDVCGVP